MASLNSTQEQAYKTAFSNTVYELTQQTQARLRGIVEMEPLQADQLLLNRVGSAEVQVLNERFPDIVPADLQWDRRRLKADRIGVPFFSDNWDAQKMLTDPNSVFAKRAVEALERHFDRVVIGAATATVYTGKDGTTPVTAATDGVQTVDATAGLTYNKLLEIDEKLQKNEVGTEMPIRKFFLISEQEHTQLMKEGSLTSGDFSRRYVIDQGNMTRALDFELIVYGSNMPIPMLNVASSVRDCLVICAGAIKIGLSQSWEVDVQDRTDKWFTKQILASGILGGVRMEGIRIIKVQTTAT